MRKTNHAILLGLSLAAWGATAQARSEPIREVSSDRVAEKTCLACHEGIEQFSDGPMMAAIKGMGAAYGDPRGCVVCHGGDPGATSADAAHSGAPDPLVQAGGPEMFYPDPGSVWIADRTCGQCHSGYADRVEKSLMNTEAGKLQGNLWSWGVQEGHKVVWGNYDLQDDDGPTPQIGTEAYKEYVTAYAQAHPEQVPSALEQVPEVEVAEIPDHPELAGITYSRQQCQRCHVGVTGREKRGDYRGTGCSACHVPYSNEGYYEGGDPMISKEKPGKLLVHRLQATRKSKVRVGDIEYSGIPSETCNSCHNRGKRIGVSFQGIMEFPYDGPYGSGYQNDAGTQPKLHTKRYLSIKDDLHHQAQSRPENPEGGMLCQDCHTSIGMHGDGNVYGTTLAQVQIECSDCHGTPRRYPWELPLGYGEEFQQDVGDEPRGLADKLPGYMSFATAYPAEDGYLLTARGNPFGNVVRKDDKVIVHSASGKDFLVPVLKSLEQADAWSSPDARVAMGQVTKHMDSMECYACHSDWAPQCYGCHIEVDYSGDKEDIDWILNANSRQANGLTVDNALGTNGLTSPGKVTETRSYLRWERPALGINGEGRVSPMMPGCQVVTTVIDADGNRVAENKIWMTPDGKGLDQAAVQPHTTGRKARSCESCHDDPKALGYGIEGGVFGRGNDGGLNVDLKTATGEVIPQRTQFQRVPIPGLDHDLSQFVTRDGEQLVSVGSHWPLTGPLPQEMREKMERTGLCLGCHQEMTNEELWSKVSTPGWVSNKQHQEVMNKLLRAYARERAGTDGKRSD